MTQFEKRCSSFVWRFGVAALIFSLEWFSANLGLLDLPTPFTLMIAYVLNEVTKYVRVNSDTV